MGNFTATTCTKDDRIGRQRHTSKKKKDKSFHDCEDKNYEIRIENILCGSESEDEIIPKGDTAAEMNILCNVHGIENILCGSKSEDEIILKGDTAAGMDILCSVHHIENILCGSKGEDEIILKGDTAARIIIREAAPRSRNFKLREIEFFLGVCPRAGCDRNISAEYRCVTRNRTRYTSVYVQLFFLLLFSLFLPYFYVFVV